jgi:imidazolonepropionase-like amidohydrolase
MRRIVAFLVCLSLLAGSLTVVLAQRTGDLKPTVHAIRDARVVTEAGKVLPKATVVIRDGQIETVGPDVKVPADALVLEGKGMVVYPGLIDALSSWGFDAALRRSAVGDAAPEDFASEALAATKPDNRKGMTPEFLVRNALKNEEDFADNWRKAGITAHLIAPEGGIFVGQSALISLSGASPRDSVLASPVAQHLAFQQLGGTDYPRVLMGIVAHTRQVLLDAGHHGRLTEAFEVAGRVGRRPPADPALAALSPALAGKQPVVIAADTRDQIDRALNFAAEFKLRPIIYGGREAYKSVERLAAEKVPVILRLDFTDETSPLVTAQERGMPRRVRDERRQERQREAGTVGVLINRGVQVSFATQGLTPDKFRGSLLKAINASKLPADTMLAALTTAPARLFGVEGQLGSIAKGKAAHLIVTDGDFFAGKARVRHTFADGVRFDHDTGPRAVTRPTATPPAGAETAGPPGTGRRPGGRRRPPEGGRTRADVEEKNKAAEEEEKGKRGAKKEAPEDPSKPDVASEIEADRKPAVRTGGNVLLRGATVLPVSGEAMPATDILVRNGKIAAIGKGLEAPEGVQVLDMTGLFIMPGIIDTHCHFAISGGVNEFSLSIVPEVRVADVINSEDTQIYRALAGGVTTARLLHGSANVIGGQDAVIKLKYGRDARSLLVKGGPRGVKFALGENVKRTDGRFPNTRLGVEAVLVRAFTEAREYRKTWDMYRSKKAAGERVNEPRRDLRLEALADVLSGDLKVHCHCYRADEILMLLRVADRFGFQVRSLQHVLEGYKVAAEIAKHGASCSPFSDWWAYKWEAADAIPYCAALLHEAGISVCLKSDSNELMRHMYQEAAKAIKYGGMSELDALKTITLNGAKQLGLDKRTGSIEVGKDADLAIFNGHPLNSFSRVEMTIVEGEIYFQRSPELKGFAPAAVAPAKPLFRAGERTPPPAPPRSGEGSKKPSGPPSPLRGGSWGEGLPSNDTGSYALINATVHPVSGPVIEMGTVIVEKGKITDVRESKKEDSELKGAMDAAGLHVYPGMIDAGSVIGLIEVDSARETSDHREGGDFQPDLRASTAINPDSELIPATRANGVLSVVTRPTGGIVAGQSALINLRGWVPSEMTVVDPLGLQVELPGGMPGIGRGSPFGMRGGAINRRVRDQKLKRLRELFREAQAHDRARKESPESPANPRLEALAPYARGEKPVFIQAARKTEIEEAMKLADELKIKVVITGGTDAWKVAPELKKHDIPVVVGPILSLPPERHDPYDAAYACPAKLHSAGVRFCIRSNGDNNTRNLPYHAAMAVSYGLPPEEGLKAVTLYPAQILGVADRLGSIEKGKSANLVITGGDMLQASTQVVGLIIDGKPVAPVSKQTRLYERYRERLREVKEGTAPLGTK